MTDPQPAPTRAYALIELGNADAKTRKLLAARIIGFEHDYLFKGTPEQEIKHLGPLLVAFPADRSRIAQILCDWDANHPQAIAYLDARSDLPTLADHLRSRLTVVLPDKQERLFRFYDPTVLPVLHEDLDNAQHKAFWESIAAWRWPGGPILASDCEGRREPTAAQAEPAPEASKTLPPGHFRLNGPLWNRLSFAADMRQIRQVVGNDPDFPWFIKLDREHQNKIFDEVVAGPLKESGLTGLANLHTAALLAMSYPLRDVWTQEEIKKSVEEARRGNADFRQALGNNVSAETWAELASDDD